MIAPERWEYVFGGADPRRWREGVREGLLEERFPGRSRLQLVTLAVVLEQLFGDVIPEVRQAARRLVDGGLGVDEALGHIALVAGFTLRDVTQLGKEFDHAGYAAQLARLPLPDGDRIEAALLDLAERAVVLDTDELVAVTVAALGRDEGDAVTVELVERAEEELSQALGPLAWLAGERTAHVAALCAGIVLTHELGEDERELGVLDLGFDLAVFARVPEPSHDGDPLALVAHRDGDAWEGPSGWLEAWPAGTALAVRVGPDGAVRLDALPAAPPAEPASVEAARRAYELEAEAASLPVTGEELVLAMLAEDRAALTSPRAPLDTLCRAAGLERRGDRVADDPDVWANEERGQRAARLFARARADDDVRGAASVLGLAERLADGEEVDAAAVRLVLELLEDPDLLRLAGEELFDPEGDLADGQALVDRALASAGRASEVATARLLAALAAEAGQEWVLAEQHLELAVEADPGHAPANERLAWYVGDRGDAARAGRLLRRCPPSLVVDQDLEALQPFLVPERAQRGRNEPCWCGSGRKFKHCHLGAPRQASLPDRVGWLAHKAVAYVERSGWAAREDVLEIARARAQDPEDPMSIVEALGDALVLDLVLVEGGWFQDFLEDRGSLLPDDEALLAASWATVDRTVYEVTAVRPGSGIEVHDLASGETFAVRERAFSRDATPGMLVCARAVPDGETHQFVGAVLHVPPGRETDLLDLLDERDPFALAEWARAREAPPRLRTREGEPLVECAVVVHAEDTGDLVAHLDRAYDREDEGLRWLEHHALDADESIIRAWLHLDGHHLAIRTTSEERADRILGELHAATAVRVVSDERQPFDAQALAAAVATGPPTDDTDPPLDPAAVEELQLHLEDRWMREPVPALGSLTPAEAAADPTRREQLLRLLASFDDHPIASATFAMRPDRIRRALGL